MTKFKVGDKFIPRKPKNNNRNGWVSGLDRFDGKILTVSGIGRADLLQVKETGFVFDPDWCEKVEHISDSNEETTNRAQPIKPRFPADRIEKGQKPYAPNWYEEGEPIVEPSKTIDWEQRRYEVAKELMASQIGSLYLKSKHWNYTDEARYAIFAADVLIKQLHSPEN